MADKINIKCTDKRHADRSAHDDAEVRKRWNDDVLATSSKPAREYSLVCRGCSLANEIDVPPEFEKPQTFREQLADLNARLKAVERR